MISLGLSSADQKLFEQSLYTGYNLKVTVQILDLNHKYISDVSSQLVDGQVNYAYLEPITYSASLTLLDPDNLVGFDTSSPSDNALYADRMIRIVYSVYSELLPRWVDVPIFCGPVTKVNRDDAIMSVECQGKESLVSEPAVAWITKTYRKGTKGVSAIRDLMANKAGETKFDLPGFGYTLGRDYNLLTESVVWTFAKSLAGPTNTRQLFYDGRGVLRLRETPTQPVFTFTESHLTSVPKLDYNHADIRNGVRVIGEPRTLLAYRYLPPTHPSSSTALGRNGVRRHMMNLVENSDLKTQSAVNAEAQRLIDRQTTTEVGFEFESFPIPHLEPGDMFHLSTRDVSLVLTLREYSIPLRAGAQSNGTVRKLSFNRARIRRR